MTTGRSSTPPLGDDFPVARPKSLITGEDTKITWSANWDDNLGGVSEQGHLDPIVQRVRQESEEKIKFDFQQTFMFYLPRICEHCSVIKATMQSPQVSCSGPSVRCGFRWSTWRSCSARVMSARSSGS
jgi:nitrate reductase beta subunit